MADLKEIFGQAKMKKLSHAEINFYLGFVAHADENGFCFPKISTVAEMIGILKQSGSRLFKKLVSVEFIRKEKSGFKCLVGIEESKPDVYKSKPDVYSETAESKHGVYSLIKGITISKNTNSVSNETGVPPENDSLSAVDENMETSAGRIIWKVGVRLLMKDGKPETTVRKFLGKLAQKYGNENLAEAIAATEIKNPVEFESYLIGVLQNKIPKVSASAASFSIESLEQRETEFLAELKTNGVQPNV